MKKATLLIFAILAMTLHTTHAQSIFGNAYNETADAFIQSEQKWFQSTASSFNESTYIQCMSMWTILTKSMTQGEFGELSDGIKIIHTINAKILKEARKRILNSGKQEKELDNQYLRYLKNLNESPEKQRATNSFCNKIFLGGLGDRK